MNFLVIVNDPGVPVGRFAEAAADCAHTITEVNAFDGAELPDPGNFDGLVSLGGRMGAYEEDEHPYLATEKRFLADAVDRGIPVLGLCLGSQLLADALGGRAYRADKPEVVFEPVTCLDQADRAVAALAAGPVVRFHQDTWEAPPGATVTATGGGFNQVFRYGSALAVQPHPEVTQESLAEWATSPESVDLRERAEANGGELVAAFRASEADMAGRAHAFFSAWFDEIEERSHTG